jgi:hypothetical protein
MKLPAMKGGKQLLSTVEEIRGGKPNNSTFNARYTHQNDYGALYGYSDGSFFGSTAGSFSCGEQAGAAAGAHAGVQP